MPRPTKRTDEAAEIILSALENGETRTEALRRAGMDDNTFYRWLKDDAELKEAVAWAELDGRCPFRRYFEGLDRGRAEAKARVQELIRKARAGDASCLVGVAPSTARQLQLLMGTHTQRTVVTGVRRVAYYWRASQVKRRDLPRCGATTRKGTPCQACRLPGKARCGLHGGLSTGPKTAEGRARIAESNKRRAGGGKQ